MDKAALVSLDIGKGVELLDALDAARQFDSLSPREAYGFLHDVLTPAGFTPRTTPPIMILPMTDPFIRALRRLFAKTKSVEGMRLGGQMIGDRFVEDAYVYRIS